MDLLFGSKNVDIHPTHEDFKLHMHDHFEIFMFIDGDTDYIVEGSTYSLSKYDIILIKPGEMHRPYHKSSKRYERVVFEIPNSFFEKFNCTQYMTALLDREPGAKNKIPSEFVQQSGILDAINRYFEYADDEICARDAIQSATLVEILHAINNVNSLYDENAENNIIREMISYINKNYIRKINLSELEDKFFLSKYHLCKIFKKATGYTIINYINNKRITETRKLCKEGMNITNACIEAGFSGYSSFYKAYQKEYGTPPKTITCK